MMKLKSFVVVSLLLIVLSSTVLAKATTSMTTGMKSATTAICNILQNIQWLLYAIAAGIGIVVVTLQGIKWAGSAEDPGARKQAKQGIIHAIIGLIIVFMAIWLVMIVFTSDKCGISNNTG
jgi:hypothetical protein